MRVARNLACPFQDTHNKDYSILGVPMGFPLLGKVACESLKTGYVRKLRSLWLPLQGKVQGPGGQNDPRICRMCIKDGTHFSPSAHALLHDSMTK